MKTTEDEDFSLKKKQTTRKDDDDGAFFREKSLRDESDGDGLSALLSDDVAPNASFDSVEAMEISSNKETRTTTLRTINREKATTGDKIVDVVLSPPSLSSSLSSLSSSDDSKDERDDDERTMLLSS